MPILPNKKMNAISAKCVFLSSCRNLFCAEMSMKYRDNYLPTILMATNPTELLISYIQGALLG